MPKVGNMSSFEALLAFESPVSFLTLLRSHVRKEVMLFFVVGHAVGLYTTHHGCMKQVLAQPYPRVSLVQNAPLLRNVAGASICMRRTSPVRWLSALHGTCHRHRFQVRIRIT